MRSIIFQAIRFGVVGVGNSAIGLAVIYSFLYFLECGPIVANAAGYSLGVVVSFILNRRWTFRNRGAVRRQLIPYLIIVGAAYLSNLGAVAAGVYLFEASAYSVQFVGMGFYTIIMFLGCRYFAFALTAPHPSPSCGPANPDLPVDRMEIG